MKKIQYKMWNGKMNDIEVSEEVANAIAAFERQDKSAKRKARRHNVASLEALYEETEWEPADTNKNTEADYIANEERMEIKAAVDNLNSKKCNLVYSVFYDEISAKELAVKENISFQAVYKKLNSIYTELRKNLYQIG